MRIAAVTCFVLLLVIGKVHAQATQTPSAPEEERAAEFFLSDRSGQFRYFTPVPLVAVPMDANFGFFVNENRDVVGTAGLLFKTNLELGPLSVGVGPQLYAALLGNPDRDDVVSVAFGGDVRYDLLRSYGIAFMGEAYYGPSILTFGQANNLTDFMARAELRIVQGMVLFAGYRWFKFNLSGKPGERLENAGLVGIRWEFH